MTPVSEALANVPLFSSIGMVERDFLATRVKEAQFNAGDVLFHYGDPGHSMYVVTAGQVELAIRTKTGEDMVLATRAENEFFGEISLMDGGPRTATARAISAVKVLEIDRVDLQALIRAQPDAGLHLLSATGSRLRETTQTLRNASTRNANVDIEERRTVAVRVTDWIALFAGSLFFLCLHVFIFAAWLGWNTIAPAAERFDSYPFGFLTLVVTLETIMLSVFVLLSQNRQTERDRVRNDIEYDVNLKAEMQIAHMHEKFDQLYAAFQSRLDRIEQKLDDIDSSSEARPG